MKITPLPDSTTAAAIKPSSKDHVRHAAEGVDPKTGTKMMKVELTGCHTPQQVWYNPSSRVALPVKE